jgi:hypothetical protein
MVMRTRGWAASLLLAALAGCASGESGVVVVVGTDYDAATLGTVVASLMGPGEEVWDEAEFPVEQAGLLFSFGVAWPEPADGQALRLMLTAYAQDGSFLLAREVDVMADPSRSPTLFVYLASQCEGQVCGEGQTCTELGCESVWLAPEQVVDMEAGHEMGGLCTPGAASCVDDGAGVERCERFGLKPVKEACASGQSCRGAPPSCQPPSVEPEVVYLQVQVSGPGVVKSTAPPFACADSGRYPVQKGTSVQLEAVADGAAVFEGWGGACAGASTCGLVMDQDREVQAAFHMDTQPGEHAFSVRMEGAGRGTLTSDDGKLNCPGVCATTYPHQTAVTVRAQPTSGSIFAGWQGPCASVSEPVCAIYVEGPVEVRPRYEPLPTAPARFDLNGDGFSDLVYAAPGAGPSGLEGAGKVYVRLGPVAAAATGAGQADHVYLGPEPRAELGHVLSADADLTGDGVVDLIIGAPGAGLKTGAVLAIPGGAALPASGRLIDHPMTLGGGRTGEGFGAALTTRADLDGDGRADLVVGAPGAAARPGRVYVYLASGFSQTGGPSPAVIIEGEQPGDAFGWAVQSAGDLDQDGRDELLVSAPRYDAGSMMDAGRVYLFKFATHLASAREAEVTLTGDAQRQLLGFSVTGLGDWQGDAGVEWAVSSHVNDAVYVFNGFPTAASGLGAARWTLRGVGFFGAALGGFEDYTGDGRPDLVVGAPIDGGQGKGSVRVYAGGGPTMAPAFQVNSDCVDAGLCAEEGLGYTVGPVGDLDLDGVPELGLGARFGGGAAGPAQIGRVVAFDLTAPGRPAMVGSSAAGWTVTGEPIEGGNCAAVSGGPAFWYDAAQPTW